MGLREQVIQSQLIPPNLRSNVLQRTRIEGLLDAVLDHPITLIQAGTGYGKTTSLSALAQRFEPVYWYNISETDRDPLLFLSSLFLAFEQRGEPLGSDALEILEEMQGRALNNTLPPLINSLTANLHQDTLIVLDDYHRVIDVNEINKFVEKFIEYCPPKLHIIISSRKTPPFESLSRWRVKGKLLTIRREELAFTQTEIQQLFKEQHQLDLSNQHLDALTRETGGWVIALQMIWQSLQSGSADNIHNILNRPEVSLETLFDYLASEVLSQQPETVQRFLITSSVLRQMEPEICDLLLKENVSKELLVQLQNNGLFIASLGENIYQYQNLFHDFLRSKLWEDPELAKKLNRKTAQYYLDRKQTEQSIHYLLEADEYFKAADLIAEIGDNLIAIGRSDSLLAWFESFPEEVFALLPELLLLKGEIMRLRSNFTEALEYYQIAAELFVVQQNPLKRSHALRGQAQIYLDTIRPLKAEKLLEDALKLLEPQEYHSETAALLDKLAENKLNQGHPNQAQALHHEAQLLRNETDPGAVYLEARASLRTGNLSEGRLLLEIRAEEEKSSRKLRPQRFHRETLLLLSLICIFQGDTPAADAYASEGIKIGRQLNSSFVEAVGMIRKAHSLQMDHLSPWFSNQLEEAKNLYLQAIEKVRVFQVTRVQVEPLWALSRLHGYQGELIEANEYARRAIKIADQAGDKWLGTLAKTNLAASHILASQIEQGQQLLEESRAGFIEVSDTFGLTAVLLWQAKAFWVEGETSPAMQKMKELLALAKKNKYDDLLTKPSFLGLKDEDSILPLLIEAKKMGIEDVYIEQILRKKGLVGLEYHPGFSLYVQTLGLFESKRGGEKISPKAWQREKARQLFQLLLTRRGEWLQRDQIVDLLWPDLGFDAAQRDFKVAHNALNRTLEPSRPRGTSPFFIVRHENQYGLNPLARIVIDSEVFEELASSERQSDLENAVGVYQGDYLADNLYTEWSQGKRDHLRSLYLSTLEKLANILLEKEKWDKSITRCEQILQTDRTWEEAYRMLMKSYAGKKNRSQIHNIYQRCIEVLDEELAIAPEQETQTLFKQLTQT